MEEKKNKVLQAVICNIISYIKEIPLAAPLAQTQIYANCASGSCLQPSFSIANDFASGLQRKDA